MYDFNLKIPPSANEISKEAKWSPHKEDLELHAKFCYENSVTLSNVTINDTSKLIWYILTANLGGLLSIGTYLSNMNNIDSINIFKFSILLFSLGAILGLFGVMCLIIIYNKLSDVFKALSLNFISLGRQFDNFQNFNKSSKEDILQKGNAIINIGHEHIRSNAHHNEANR